MLMRPIEIREVMNGYIVQAGCQTLVFRNITDLCAELKRYAEDPYRVEQEYLAKYRAEKGEGDVQAPGGLPGPQESHHTRAQVAHLESQRFMQGPQGKAQSPSPVGAAYGLGGNPGFDTTSPPDAPSTTTFR